MTEIFKSNSKQEKYDLDYEKLKSIKERFPNTIYVKIKSNDSKISSNSAQRSQFNIISQPQQTMAQLINYLKAEVNLQSNESLIVQTMKGKLLPISNQTMSEVFQQYNDQKGYLELQYNLIETIG